MRFLLERKEADALITNMEAQVRASWYATARAAGVSERDCEKIAPAFAYPGFRPERKAGSPQFTA
jgi:serine/threonine-protein kinase HipA